MSIIETERGEKERVRARDIERGEKAVNITYEYTIRVGSSVL